MGSTPGGPFNPPTAIREEVNVPQESIYIQSGAVAPLPLMGVGYGPMGLQPQVISENQIPVGLQEGLSVQQSLYGGPLACKYWFKVIMLMELGTEC